MTLLILILCVVLLLAIGVPVVYALIVPSIGYYVVVGTAGLSSLVPSAVSGINSFPLLAVPLFILMGNLANETKVTEKLFNLAEALLGHLRCSLGYVNIAVSFGFSWMSGSAIADSAGLGRLEVPQMVRRGYSERFSTGITGASAIVGPIMPPSIPAVLYAVAAGTSLGGLLAAGILPAFLLVTALALSVFIYSRRVPGQRQPRSSMSTIVRTAGAGLPSLFAPVILLTGILGGVFTPTEAAAVAVTYLLVLGVVQRTLAPRQLYQALVSTAKTVGAILFIVAAASIFGMIIALERGPQLLADLMLGISDNQIVFLLLVNVLVLIVGMLLEPASALLILVPVLLPIAQVYEIHPLHFGSIIILNLMIGLLTPPIGLIMYVVSSVTNIPVTTVMRGTSPFLAPLIIVLLIVTYVPAVTLTLPGVFGFG